MSHVTLRWSLSRFTACTKPSSQNCLWYWKSADIFYTATSSLALVKAAFQDPVQTVNIVFSITNAEPATVPFWHTLLHSYQPTRLLRSSTQGLLTVPHCKTVFGGHRFSVAAPGVWNSLPQELRNCETLGTFKKHLNTHLFCQDII